METLIDINEKEYDSLGQEQTVRSRLKIREKGNCAYRTYIQSGIPLPMNTYGISDTDKASPMGYVIQDDGSKYFLTSGFVGGFVHSNYPEMENAARAECARRFYQNASGQTLNIGVAMGELPQTVNMIGSTARRLASSFSSLKRLDIDGAFNALKMGNYSHRQQLRSRSRNLNASDTVKNHSFAADSWLEMKYGWKPLLHDVEDAAALAAKSQSDNPERPDIRIQGMSRKRVTVTGPANPGEASISVTGSGYVQVGMVAYYTITDLKVRNMQKLGLQNLGEVAWELVPYSFVVDWFLPVGSYIQALGATNGLTYGRGCTSTKRHVSGVGICTSAFGKKGRIQEFLNFNAFDRTVGIETPASILRFKGIKEALNVDKTITSLALLEQAFRK